MKMIPMLFQSSCVVYSEQLIVISLKVLVLGCEELETVGAGWSWLSMDFNLCSIQLEAIKCFTWVKALWTHCECWGLVWLNGYKSDTYESKIKKQNLVIPGQYKNKDFQIIWKTENVGLNPSSIFHTNTSECYAKCRLNRNGYKTFWGMRDCNDIKENDENCSLFIVRWFFATVATKLPIENCTFKIKISLCNNLLSLVRFTFQNSRQHYK